MTEASQMIQLACPVHQKLALPAVVDRNALDWGRLSWARVINHLWCSPDWQLYGTSSIQPRIGQKDKCSYSPKPLWRDYTQLPATKPPSWWPRLWLFVSMFFSVAKTCFWNTFGKCSTEWNFQSDQIQTNLFHFRKHLKLHSPNQKKIQSKPSLHFFFQIQPNSQDVFYLSKSHMAPFPRKKKSKLFAYVSFVIFVSPFVHVWPIFLFAMSLSHLGERQTGETKKTHRNRRFEVSFGSHGDPISEGDLLHQGCPWWRVPLVPFR